MSKGARELLFDSSRQMVNTASDLAVQDPGLFQELFRISLEQERDYGQRASRVVYQAGIMKPEWADGIEGPMVDSLHTLHNEAVVRSFLRLLKDRPLPADEARLSKLVDFCFRVLEDRGRSIAVVAYAMSILSATAGRFPELGDELIAYLSDRADDESPGISTHARQIIRELKFRS